MHASTSARHEVRWLNGSAESFEVLIDHPPEPIAQVLIMHPHPKLGGDARHKVPFMIARALLSAGFTCWRPSLKSAGSLEGTHAGDTSGLDELCGLLKVMQVHDERLPILIVGFSFGAHLVVHLARSLPPDIEIADFLLCGLPAGSVQGRRFYDTPPLPGAFVIHGESDQSVPLGQVLEWAAPHAQAVTVVPKADHFFSGRLPVLTGLLVERALSTLSLGSKRISAR